MSAYPSAEESQASLAREGWEVSVTRTPSGPRPLWVVRATKGRSAVEGRGVTEAEAWYAACREAFKGGRA